MKPALFSVLCEIKEKTGKTPLYSDIVKPPTAKENNSGASVQESTDIIFFHLPVTRWQPEFRLQGTSAQIN